MAMCVYMWTIVGDDTAKDVLLWLMFGSMIPIANFVVLAITVTALAIVISSGE
jgi:hypothetical protein